ncbi:hypothetical protein KFU94_18305 [Chloroflexi bacterium TSY]|nr:hypothetical protein [Chloroflexi bacterium TSY]
MLILFWSSLGQLPSLLLNDEHLRAEQLTAHLRALVLELMLALNGIAPPSENQPLNQYLGQSQREAIEKTLLTPVVSARSWVGHAVALIVIYRWYAPQLVEKYC